MGIHRKDADTSGHQRSIPKEVTPQRRSEGWETKRQGGGTGEECSRQCYAMCYSSGPAKEVKKARRQNHSKWSERGHGGRK